MMEKTYSDVNISTNNPPITASKASKKRNYVTTRGNSCKFPQQVKKMSKLNATALYEVKPELTEMEISLELCKLRHCCPVGGDLGCIQNHFHDTSGVDICFSESIKFFKQMRNHTRCIMEFKLDKIKAFAAAYGISIKALERCPLLLKVLIQEEFEHLTTFGLFGTTQFMITTTQKQKKCLNLTSVVNVGNILIKLTLLLYLFIYNICIQYHNNNLIIHTSIFDFRC